MRTKEKWGKLSRKITLIGGLSVALGFAVMVGLIAKISYDSALEQGYQLASEQAQGYARQVEAELGQNMVLPHHLAEAVLGLKKTAPPERKVVDGMIVTMLDHSPQNIGLWMLWEPNALDGRDDAYRLDWPRHDPTGRYTPYVTRDASGHAKMDVMLDAERVKAFPKYKDNPQSYQPDYEKPGWGDYYYVPKQRGRDTITEPFFYEVQGKKVLESSLVTMIKDQDDKFIGVSATDLALDALQQRYGFIRLYQTGYVRLVSEGGMYVANPDPAKVGKPVGKDEALGEKLLQIRQGENFVFEADGFTHFFFPVKIGDTGQFWSLGVSIPSAAITAPALKLRNSAILIGVLALIAIIAILALVVGALTRPLNQLADTMEQLASGQGDLTARIAIANRDEIGRTATAFNRFIDSLHGMFVGVREQSHAVAEAAARLTASAGQVEQASAAQSDTASATAAGVEQVSTSVQHIADSAGRAEELARQTGSITDQSVVTVKRVAAEIDSMTGDMHALAERMGALGSRSEEVSSIVRVIRDIADQTNLLALNAAIEAARAGEQGRGFAVVADEVRNLAGRTAEATLEIGRIVEAIGRETRDAVREVDGSRERAVSSVGVAQAADGSMQQVSHCSQQLVGNIVDIAAATREQSSASAEIARHVEQISAMAQSNRDVVQEVSAAAEQLHTLSANLEQLVGHFRL
ncbi:methyl-accepting chemotaxis protein [Pseudogulbenkiania ferrooxidans]|uniref:Methyl-accepting chemotaxis sensory transducer n=1 Tax=Pseudogulbenkiania ferrooxidans 2002 TaxID=279714 RepID=B9Z7S5_9NEIS|nr:methyl-accepting chemotaxis protein [Pseudogulbenkiania ferrooxidans]EEG07211.1 methyl-accepting chemotaxis sensory transducer [Pseudogulbenkiania ferrooxidans 2002]